MPNCDSAAERSSNCSTTVRGSDFPPEFLGIEVFSTDQSPELCSTERCPNTNQLERSMSSEKKMAWEINQYRIDNNPAADIEPSPKWKKWLLIMILAVTIIIVLAIALPLSLRHRGSESRKSSNLSTTGAYNRTGLTLLQLGTSSQDYSWHLYYQHASGEIRDMELKDYEWVHASYTNVGLPASAKNGTPLAVASFAENALSYPTYHIYYIDSSGVLQETINADGASKWHRGSLGNLNVMPSTALSVGLAACSNEQWNGGKLADPVLELYYGGRDNLVHELIYNFNSQEWTSHALFPNTNGNAELACSASNTSISYMFSSSMDNKLELWWKDSNTTVANSAANTTAHPLGVWTKVLNPSPITLHPNSSISRIRTSDTENLVFFLTPSLAISALQPSLAAENSTWGSPLDVTSAVAGMGSRMATGTMFEGNYTLMPNMTDQEKKWNLGFHVFFQEGDGGIREFVREYEGGQWTSGEVLGL